MADLTPEERCATACRNLVKIARQLRLMGDPLVNKLLTEDGVQDYGPLSLELDFLALFLDRDTFWAIPEPQGEDA